MAPRANWKGYLRLSLVSCPIALYPATTVAEKTRFHQINSKTGNRIKMQRIDAETGKPVDYEDITKGYEVTKGHNIELSKEELEAVAVESTRTIEITTFVPKDEIDELYIADPYYIVPDGKVGTEAFAVIREAIKKEGKVAIGKLVLTTREHIVALEPRGKGLVGMLLRYPYEVRDEKEYFDDIPDIKITKDMLDLAKHIVDTKTGHFEPEQFEDTYEEALKKLLARKAAGKPIEAAKREEPSNVVNLMDALRQSVEAVRHGDSERRAPAKHRAAAHARRTPARKSHPRRKAG